MLASCGCGSHPDGLGNFWTDLLGSGVATGEVLAINRFGTPSYDPGTYIQTAADGSQIVYRQGTNAENVFHTTNTSAGILGSGIGGTAGGAGLGLFSSPLVLLALAGAAFFMLKGRR